MLFIAIIAAPVYSTRAGAAAAVDCNCKILFSVSPLKAFFFSSSSCCREGPFIMTADLFLSAGLPLPITPIFYTLEFFKEHPCERLCRRTWVCAWQPPRACLAAPRVNGALAAGPGAVWSAEGPACARHCPPRWAMGLHAGWRGGSEMINSFVP